MYVFKWSKGKESHVRIADRKIIFGKENAEMST